MDPSNPNIAATPPRISGGARRGASTAAARQRHVEDDRRRQDVDEADGTTACRPTRSSGASASTSRARSPPTIYASIEVGPSGGTGAGVNDDGTLRRPASGRRAAVGAGAAAQPPPDPNEARHLAIGRWREDVEVPVEPDGSAGCTTARSASIPPIPRSPIRAARRSSRPSMAARRGSRCRASRTATITRSGSIRRNGNHLMVGNDGGLDVTYDQGETWEYVNTRAGRPVLQGQRRHAEAVLRLRRAAGQRQLVRPERDAQQQRHPQLRLVPRSAAATASTPQNDPSRLVDPVFGVAGRRDEPRVDLQRRADASASGRATAQQAAARRHGAGARRRIRRPPAQFRSAGAERHRQHRPGARRRARPTASTGTRRSSCRRTIRERSISAAIGCSVRTNAATRGWRRPT